MTSGGVFSTLREKTSTKDGIGRYSCGRMPPARCEEENNARSDKTARSRETSLTPPSRQPNLDTGASRHKANELKGNMTESSRLGRQYFSSGDLSRLPAALFRPAFFFIS